jgi:hypothetical protein
VKIGIADIHRQRGEREANQQSKGRKRVDFWLSGKLRWAVDVVREGGRIHTSHEKKVGHEKLSCTVLEEHCHRFAGDGPYTLLPVKEWCVVDIRCHASAIEEWRHRCPNAVIVHCARDFTSADVHIGKRHETKKIHFLGVASWNDEVDVEEN